MCRSLRLDRKPSDLEVFNLRELVLLLIYLPDLNWSEIPCMLRRSLIRIRLFFHPGALNMREAKVEMALKMEDLVILLVGG